MVNRILKIQNEIQSVWSVELEEDALQRLLDNPKTSIRSVGPELGINNNCVWQVLHEKILHPFHIQKVHVHSEGDYPHGFFLSVDFQTKVAQSPGFFKFEGIFNYRNSHIWVGKSPHVTEQHGHHKFSVNVWTNILNDNVINFTS